MKCLPRKHACTLGPALLEAPLGSSSSAGERRSALSRPPAGARQRQWLQIPRRSSADAAESTCRSAPFGSIQEHISGADPRGSGANPRLAVRHAGSVFPGLEPGISVQCSPGSRGRPSGSCARTGECGPAPPPSLRPTTARENSCRSVRKACNRPGSRIRPCRESKCPRADPRAGQGRDRAWTGRAGARGPCRPPCRRQPLPSLCCCSG